MFQIKIITTPDNIERLRTRGPAIIDALTQRMNLLMFKLQSKIVGETIPAFFPSGAPNIASTVRAIPAQLEGTVVHGEVQAGGPRTTKVTLRTGAEVDYAAVQEVGIYHSYQILPFNKKMLSFLIDGKRVFAKMVTHPGLMQRPYMRYGLQEMEAEIYAGLSEEVSAMLA